MAESLEALKRKRAASRGWLTRAVQNLQEVLNDNNSIMRS